MKIKFGTWVWYCLIVAVICLSLGILDIIEPTWWSKTYHTVFLAIVVAAGCSGGLMAILLRTGAVEFIYTERDKKKFLYKMAQLVAEMENQNPSVKDLYSKKYFQSFDDSKSNESDKNSSGK